MRGELCVKGLGIRTSSFSLGVPEHDVYVPRTRETLLKYYRDYTAYERNTPTEQKQQGRERERESEERRNTIHKNQ